MNQLTLTTNQITAGLLITRENGPVFYSSRLVLLVVALWLALLVFRLGADTLQAGHLLTRLVWANIAHHLYILRVGLEVVVQYGY